jgi:hypothetical protein
VFLPLPLTLISSINTKTDLRAQLNCSKLDETLRKVSTTSLQINYFDEAEDLNFINSNILFCCFFEE